MTKPKKYWAVVDAKGEVVERPYWSPEMACMSRDEHNKGGQQHRVIPVAIVPCGGHERKDKHEDR